MKKTLSKTLLWATVFAGALVATFVATAAQVQGGPRESSDRWLSLADSVQPLRDHFNQHNGEIRFVALLSPT